MWPGRKERLADIKRLAGDRIAFRQWTEDPKLQSNRDIKKKKFLVRLSFFLSVRVGYVLVRSAQKASRFAIVANVQV
jgi:hypothetical protein